MSTKFKKIILTGWKLKLLLLFTAFAGPSQLLGLARQPDKQRTSKAASLINIPNKEALIEKRQELIKYIWSGKGFPHDKGPDVVYENIKDSRTDDFPDIKRIDKLYIDMAKGINSFVYLFHNKAGKKELILYHQGHKGGFLKGRKTIEFFLKKGFHVMAFSMPLKGMNNQPTVVLPPSGESVKLDKHKKLRFLRSSKRSPIKFFMEPIALGINHVKKTNPDWEISMVGVSGGGWTTVVYSALDPRVQLSFPVAGSLPLYLRTKKKSDRGDYEQRLSELYRIANYLELYILGSHGPGRKQLQIFNRFDDCCFSGDRYLAYIEEVQAAVKKLGQGSFDVYLDESHKEHIISPETLDVIFDQLKTR